MYHLTATTGRDARGPWCRREYTVVAGIPYASPPREPPPRRPRRAGVGSSRAATRPTGPPVARSWNRRSAAASLEPPQRGSPADARAAHPDGARRMAEPRKRIGNGWIWVAVVLAAVLAWWLLNLATGAATT